MGTRDFAWLVTTLSYPIASEAELADTPPDATAMHDQVSALIASGGDTECSAQTDPVEGMGFGLEMLTALNVPHIVIEALLGASLHVGLMETYEMMRHWKNRRPVTVPRMEELMTHGPVIQAELRRRLAERGFDDDQAGHLAEAAYQAMILVAPPDAAPPKDGA
jgi:hypothetical protein